MRWLLAVVPALFTVCGCAAQTEPDSAPVGESRAELKGGPTGDELLFAAVAEMDAIAAKRKAAIADPATWDFSDPKAFRDKLQKVKDLGSAEVFANAIRDIKEDIEAQRILAAAEKAAAQKAKQAAKTHLAEAEMAEKIAASLESPVGKDAGAD